MTECPRGSHDFPVEDDTGAYCEEHGVTLLYRSNPIQPEDLTHDYPARPDWLTLGPSATTTRRAR